MTVVQNIVLPVIGTIIMGLLISLTWFVARLIEKVDKVDQLPLISDAIRNIQSELQELKREYKQVHEINTRVSVLEKLFDHFLDRQIDPDAVSTKE